MDTHEAAQVCDQSGSFRNSNWTEQHISNGDIKVKVNWPDTFTAVICEFNRNLLSAHGTFSSLFSPR